MANVRECKHGWSEVSLLAQLAEAEALLTRCIEETYPMKDATVAGQQKAVDCLRAHLAEVGQPLESARVPVAPELAAAGVDMERGSRIEAERVTWEFRTKSARRLDGGKKSIEDSPLFSGDRQESLF